MQPLAVLAAVGDAVAALVMFWGMAVVTEERFVPLLVLVAKAWELPADVAGATLMASGASSPELFSNLISIFVTKSDLGVGTIIGCICMEGRVMAGDELAPGCGGGGA